MKKIKYISVITVIMLILLLAYGNRKKAWPPTDPSQMPSIVFIVDCDYSRILPSDPNPYEICIYDKNGNYYGTDNREVCKMLFEELVKAFENGDLEDKITRYSRTCDVNELFENYQKLCEVSGNEELQIIYPEQIPAVEAAQVWCYGFYYDKKGKLQNLIIHEEGCLTDFYTNDKQANEIYEWYEGTFQK